MPHPRTCALRFSIAIADVEQLPNVIGAADRHDRRFVPRSSSFKRATKVLPKEYVKVTVLNRTTSSHIAAITCAVFARACLCHDAQTATRYWLLAACISQERLHTRPSFRFLETKLLLSREEAVTTIKREIIKLAKLGVAHVRP